MKYATHAASRAASAAHASATTNAPAATDYGAEFRMLLATPPAAPENPFVALLAAARVEADATPTPSTPSAAAREAAGHLQFTGETRVDARGRRSWLVVCRTCGLPSCEFSHWVSD